MLSNKKTLIFILMSILFTFILKYLFPPTATTSFDNRDNWYVEKDFIRSSYISPNQEFLVSTLASKINIYDMKTKKLLQKFVGHKGFINISQLSQDGNFFVSASSRSIKIWDVRKNSLLKKIALNEEYSLGDVLITKNAKTLIYATTKGQIIVQDIESERILQSFQHGNKTISSIALSIDEKILVSGSWEGSIKIWDLKQNTLVHTIYTKEKSICDVEISQDKKTIISSSYFNIDAWSIKGEPLQRLDTYPFKHTLIDISPNGEQIVSIGKVTKIWEKRHNRFTLVHQIENPKKNISSIDISNDSSMVAIAGKIIELKRGEVITEVGSYLKNIKSLHIRNDSKTLIVNTKDTRSSWNLEKGELIETSQIKEDIFKDEVQSNNQKIGLSYDDDIIIVRDLKSLEVLERISYNAGEDHIVAKAISNDHKTIIFANYDNDLLIWKEDRAKPIVIKKAHDAFISSIVISNDGKFYVTTSRDGSIKIWNVDDNSIKRTLQQDESVNCVAISDDGQYMVSGGGGNYTNAAARQLTAYPVRLWNLRTGVLLKTYVGHRDSILNIAISDDNKYISAATVDNVISIWERRESLRIKEFLQDNKNNWVAFDYQNKFFKKDDDGTFLYEKSTLN